MVHVNAPLLAEVHLEIEVLHESLFCKLSSLAARLCLGKQSLGLGQLLFGDCHL